MYSAPNSSEPQMAFSGRQRANMTSAIASQFSLNENASEIITGILLFFVLGCEFFINYRVEFRHRRRED